MSIRGGYVRGRRMAGFLVIRVVMAISARYELFEQRSAQSGMAFAFLGGTCTLVLPSRFHDRQIAALAAAAG